MANEKPKKNHPQIDRDKGKQTPKKVENQDSKQDQIERRGAGQERRNMGE